MNLRARDHSSPISYAVTNDAATRYPVAISRVAVAVMLSLGLTLIASVATAIPPQSITALEQGLAQVNEELPWMSGWDLDGRAQNVRQMLQLKREEVRAVYITLCHTQSSACAEQLRFLKSVRGVLESEGVDLMLIFTEEISTNELSAWLNLRGLLPSDRLQVLIDRFHRSALRLGAYQNAKSAQTLVKSNLDINAPQRSSGADLSTELQGKSKGPKQVLRVPLGLLVSKEGRVMTIVLQGGSDLTDRISGALRYLDVE